MEAVTPLINEPEPLPTPEAQISIPESTKVEPVEGSLQSKLVEKRESTEGVLDGSKKVENKAKKDEEVFTLDPIVNKAPKLPLTDEQTAEGRKSPAVSEEKEKKKKQEKGSKEVKRSETSKEKKPSAKEVKKQTVKAPKKQTASPLSSSTEEPKKKKTGFFCKLKKLFK